MPDITYPLDLSGNAASNLVENELHTVTEANFRDYFFIVPNFAPFYIDNFECIYILAGDERPLVEGVDFNFALPYVAGIRSTGKLLYGAITLNNLDIAGILRMKYQTLGGEWVVNRLHVLQVLAEKVYNPRTTIWDVVTDKPEIFPPIPHYMDYDNFYSQVDLINAIQAIADNIATYRDESAIIRHLTNTENPHEVSLEQLGIPLIGNWRRATEAEVMLGESHITLVTPETLKAVRNVIQATITAVDYRASLALQALQDYITLNTGASITYAVIPSALTHALNSPLEFQFDMAGAPYAKMFYWTLEHIDSMDEDFQTLTGSFMTDNTGSGVFNVVSSIGASGIDVEYKVHVRLGGITGPIIASSSNVTLVV